MGVEFTLKIKHRGGTPRIYKEKDAKGKTHKIATYFKNALEDEMIDMTGKMVCEAAETQKLRSLYLAAVFFQRVVSRTPVDEGYPTESRWAGIHYPDDDYVRDAWKARCNGRTISAKTLREEYGIYFETFNNEREINKIFKIFKDKFLNAPRARKTKVSVNIENTHERFAMLEYGGLIGETPGKPKKGKWSDYTGKGGKHYHGIQNGYSVQAPYGMLRITEAEFQKMSLNVSTAYILKNYVKRTQHVTKVPSKVKMKKLKTLLSKSKLTNKDIEEVVEAYGV